MSLIDSINLVRYGGLKPEWDYLQMDPILGYGLVEYLRILSMLPDYDWTPGRCIPHGGHLFGIHLAAGLGLFGMEAYPEVFTPFGKFADGMTLSNGIVKLLDGPGIGYEFVPDLYSILKEL